MRVLVTNDDGIDQPGIHALARAVRDAGHEVRVIAPSREFSGSSASLGTVAKDARVGLRAAVDWPVDAVAAWAVDAPPAMAVRAACAGVFGWRPEIVVSGVNPGHNTGRLVIHSGTVGAALTAGSFDLPGIAVSTGRGNEAFATASTLAARLVDVLAAEPEPRVVNLNVPGVALSDLHGVRAATLAPVGIVDLAWHVDGDSLTVARVHHEPPFPDGTDAALLAEGYATVSAVTGPWQETFDVTGVATLLQATLVRV